MADIHYFRVMKDKDGLVLGELCVKGTWFVAVENRSGSYDSLPLGTYAVSMSKKNKAPQVPCLRFDEVPGRNGKGSTFLMHRAFEDKWWELAGCIAPGLAMQDARNGGKSTRTVRGSEAAMNQIFDLLGGYEAGKCFTVSIDNHAPGDSMSRDEFISRRKQGKPT